MAEASKTCPRFHAERQQQTKRRLTVCYAAQAIMGAHARVP
jgi:hypothetical protein